MMKHIHVQGLIDIQAIIRWALWFEFYTFELFTTCSHLFVYMYVPPFAPRPHCTHIVYVERCMVVFEQ